MTLLIQVKKKIEESNLKERRNTTDVDDPKYNDATFPNKYNDTQTL
jgi:hypothetical protein